MEEQVDKIETGEVTDDDRLWATLAWIPVIWPIIAVVVLLIEEKKDRPFIRYHAILSLVTGVVGFILSFLCVGFFVWIAMFYFAYKAYLGEMVEVPMLTDFARNQGWL